MKMLIVISSILFFICTNLIAQGAINTLNFDGVNDYVNCGMDTSLDITDAITIEAWVKADHTQPGGEYHRIVDKYSYTAHQGYNLMIGRDIKFALLEFWATDGSKNIINDDEELNDGLWHHIAGTYDGNIMRIYVDGNIENQDTIGIKTIRACPKALNLGNGFDGNVWHPLKGKIEEVRLWNEGLDPAVVRDWMHKKVTSDHPGIAHLVGYWKFDEGAGSHTADSSGFGNHGTLTNMDTTNAWNISDAPLATNITQPLYNVSALWQSVDTNASSILTIVDTALTDEECILFGHNNDDMSWTSNDVPNGFGILNRLNRVWRFEVYVNLVGDIMFDVSNLNFTDGNALKLLIDADGVFSDADTIHGTYNPANSSFIVRNHHLQHRYYYTLGTGENIVSIKPGKIGNHPNTFQLAHNTPNPFNPVTSIQYSVGSGQFVVLKIFDILGREVKTLVNAHKPAGSYSVRWDGTNDAGQQVASGVYLYRLTVGKAFSKTRKMVLMQ